MAVSYYASNQYTYLHNFIKTVRSLIFYSAVSGCKSLWADLDNYNELFENSEKIKHTEVKMKRKIYYSY